VRILLLNQYYVPDMAPTGQVAHDLAKVLVQRGHQVVVLCSSRSYDGGGSYPRREQIDGVRAVRLSALGFGRRWRVGKMLDYFSYYLLASMNMLFRWKPDLVLAMTTPPYLGLLAKLVCRLRRIPHVHWIMDLYPDVMLADGMLKSEGRVFRWLSALSRVELRDSALVLTVAPDMAGRVEKYLVPDVGPRSGGSRVVHWIPLWGDASLRSFSPEEARNLRRDRGWAECDLVLMYSGNMGLGHRIGDFLEGARRTAGRQERGGPRIRWVFAGGGRRWAEVEQFRRDNPGAAIELLDYVPRSLLADHLATADIHLVSMRSDWNGLMAPSKLQGIFAIGKPVIFVGDEDNCVAHWIREARAGWIARDADELVSIVCGTRMNDAEMGENARAYAEEHFDHIRNPCRIAELLETAAERQS